MKKTIILLLILLFLVSCVSAENDLSSDNQIQGPESRILPKSLQKDYSNLVFLIPFFITIIAFAFLLTSNTQIAKKKTRDYLLPIKYYILGSILIVISQYLVGIPLASKYPWILQLTQALWTLMVAFSIIKLVKKHDFRISNLLITGIFYCFIIHGLKVSIRYFFYARPVWYLIDRFVYGSILVMVTVIIISPLFLYLKKKGVNI